MTNSSCNTGTIDNIFVYVFIPPFEFLAACLSGFIIFLMFRTSCLRSVAGAILINDQMTCLLDQLIVGLFCTDLRAYLSQKAQTYVVHIPLTILNSASITFTLLSNVNIYLALCQSTTYKRRVTKQRAAIAISGVWLSSIGVSLLSLVDDNFRNPECEIKLLFAKWTIDLLALHLTKALLFLIFPFGFSCFLLNKVVRASYNPPANQTLRTSNYRLKILNLVRLLLVLTIITIVLYVLLLGLRIAASFTESLLVEMITMLVGLLYRIVRGLRPGLFLVCYKPMRETLLKLIKCCRPKNQVDSVNDQTVQPSRQRQQTIAEQVL